MLLALLMALAEVLRRRAHRLDQPASTAPAELHGHRV
jgi:hypothetical protein